MTDIPKLEPVVSSEPAPHSNVTIETFRNRLDGAKPVPVLTLPKLAEALDSLPAGERCVLLPADQARDVMHIEGIDSYFDPVTRYELLNNGQLGTLFGAKVFSDGCLQHADKRFLTEPLVMLAPR